MGQGEYVTFKAKNGTTVSGYMYKPLGYTAGKSIGKSAPHGGRWAYTRSSITSPKCWRQMACGVVSKSTRVAGYGGKDYCNAIFADWGTGLSG